MYEGHMPGRNIIRAESGGLHHCTITAIQASACILTTAEVLLRTGSRLIKFVVCLALANRYAEHDLYVVSNVCPSSQPMKKYPLQVSA